MRCNDKKSKSLENKKWKNVTGERCKNSSKEKTGIKFRSSGKWCGLMGQMAAKKV